MLRLFYLRWHRRLLLRSLENVRRNVAEALEAERQFERDLQRVEAALAVEEVERRWRVRW